MPKTLSPEQEKVANKVYFQSGLKGAALGLGIGLAATVFTIRRSPDFKALSKPLQSIMAVGTTSAGFLFASDSAVTKFENKVLGYTDEEMISALRISWAASMVGALGYSFSNKYLTTQQKVVQARMYAQAVTIAVLMASAGLSIYMGDDEKERRELPDAQLRAVLELPDAISPKHESKMVKQ
ncbi:unnamed protein product [Mucor hiemalis]